MIVRRLVLILLMPVALAACRAEPQSLTAQQGPTTSEVSGLDIIPLRVQTRGAAHDFTVEMARTPEEQARGMMFRDRLGPNQGMLFPFSEPRLASFWMKNVPEPLDLIFVRTDGTIAKIAINAPPYSEDQIAVGEPVAAVLEIAGGRAVELGIQEGDRVTWTDRPAS